MVELTKDADKMLCVIYKMYLEKIKNGMSKTESNFFEDDFYKNDKTLSSWHPDDVYTTSCELYDKKYIKMYIDGSFRITDQTIVCMENRFKDGFNSVIDFITKFI